MSALNQTIADTASEGATAANEMRRGYWSTVWDRLRRDPTTIICAIIVTIILMAAIFAPLIAPYDPYKTSMLNRLAPIGSEKFILGTDELGRDMLSRLIYGGRVSLFTAIAPVLGALLLGGSLGIIAGFLGGRVNMIIMRTMDVFYAFPSILLAIAISGALGSGVFNAVISLTLIFMPPICRVAETVTTQVRNLDFVAAARATPASTMRILRVHILGNVLGPILIYASSLVSVSIIIASGLSFLGLGVRPPTPSWGSILNDGYTYIRNSKWLLLSAGAPLILVTIGFTFLGEQLRDIFDPKINRESK